MKRAPILCLAALSLLLAATAAEAHFANPPSAPVDRLIKAFEAYLKDHPDSAEAHYRLARTHYLAFALMSDTIGAREKDPAFPTIAVDSFNVGKPPIRQVWYAGASKDPIDPAVAAVHLDTAVKEFLAALKLDAGKPLYHLGLGCALEDAARIELKKAASGPELEIDPHRVAGAKMLEDAAAEYLKAYQLGIQDDVARSHQPNFFTSLVGYEAAQDYTRLVNERGPKDAEKPQIAEMAAKVKAIEALPQGPVTPIIFSLDRPATLDSLLDPSRIVSFNLDGTGRPQHYHWLKPTTAILVWDPAATGKIASGKQLFGSVTWWLFWNNGYEALAALDDNHDGRLSGDELKGLAVWIDANGNGIADPGEVVPIEKTDILWIAVHPAGAPLAAPQGIGLRDGRILPTFDWLAQPAAGEAK